MREENIKLLLLWYNKCKLFYKCNRDSANHYDFWNKMLGFPAIIINLFNSSSLLANNTNMSQTLSLLIGGLALVATILSGAQNYFEFARLKDQHTKIMIQYSGIIFSIEKLIITFQNDLTYDLDEVSLNRLLNDIEKLRETYLHFPEKIWKRNNIEFRLKLEEINLNTSDSVNMIINSLKSKKQEELEHVNEEQEETITYNNDLKISIK
jgi:hypothetical protein